MKLKNMLKENPDKLKYKGKPVRFDDLPAYPFGIYKTKMYVGNDSDYHNDLVADNGDYLNRRKFGISGRIWTKKKLISFWEFPPKNQMKKVITDIEKAFKEQVGKSVKIWGNKYQVEILRTKGDAYDPHDKEWKTTDTRFIPLEDYGGSGEQKGKGTAHAESPLLKKQKEVPAGMGSRKKVKGALPGETPAATRDRLRKGLGDGVIKLKDLIKELAQKNKWIPLTGKELEKYKQDVFDLIQTAYKGIGHPNFTKPSDISDKDAQIFRAIDLDDEPDPEAVRVWKKRPAGKKLVAIGHDGSGKAKSSVVNYTSKLLNKKGYYVEVSGRMYDILKSKGTHVIADEEIVRKVLRGKKINWVGDGWYERDIGGQKRKKIMMGYPKV